MNYSTAVFLINKNVRAVLATYESEGTARKTTFKTLDETITVDDYIVVPTETRHQMTVCKVVETDVDVNFDDPTPVHWIISKIDRAQYDQTLKEEATAVQAIKSAELRKKRDDLRQALFADHVDTLKALPIAVINGDGDKAKKAKG